MRRLNLHASALNDAEYELYTTSLTDLDDTEEDATSTTHDDAYYERMKIGVREARGWLRGRYSHVSPANIDAILRFFSPGLSQADTLSGGEFFAALRLVVHVENGRDVDRGLAFVQAHPTSSSTPVRQASPERPPPDPPSKLAQSENAGPATPGPSQLSDQTRVHNNPFTQHDEPPKTQTTHGQHNPFVNRITTIRADEPTTQPKLPPLPPRKPPPPPPPHGHSTPSHPTTVLLPPPRHNSTKSGNITSTLMKQSLQASKAAQTMKRAESQLEQERVLQVLKSSSVVSGASIQNRTGSNPNPNPSFSTYASNNPNRSPSPAARIAYGHGRGYGSSSVGSASSASASEAPPLPRRRQNQGRSQHHQQQPSPPVSVSSLEQVALASSSPSRPPPPPPPLSQSSSTNPYHRVSPMPAHTSTLTSSTVYDSPQGSPTRSSVDLQPGRPPTHPDRKPHFPHSHPATTVDTENPSQDITVPDTFLNGNGNGISPAPNTSTSTSTTTTASSYTTASGVTPESSPTARLFRSRSLHYPPPPPARRRRPESVQMLARGDVFGGAEHTGGQDADGDGEDEGGIDMDGQGQRPSSTLSRHSSLSMPAYKTTAGGGSGHARSSHSISASSSTHTTRTSYSHPATHTLPSHHESPFSNIFASIQPKLDKARYKAEAGLSRRGFVTSPLPSSSLLLGGGGSEEGGSGIGEGGRKGRKGRAGGASSVLSGAEREEREELVVHRNGDYGGGSVGRDGDGDGDGDESPNVDEVDVGSYDDQSKQLRRGMSVSGGGDGVGTRRRGTSSSRSARIGGAGSLNGVGGDAVLESDDTGGDGEGEVGVWRREVKERWGAGVRDKDELKLPAGEGWRPL